MNEPIVQSIEQSQMRREILNDLLPAGRMGDFRMELQSVKLAFWMLDRGESLIVGARGCGKPRGRLVSLSP